MIGRRVEFKEPRIQDGRWAAATEAQSIETIKIAERRSLFDTLLQTEESAAQARRRAVVHGRDRTAESRKVLQLFRWTATRRERHVHPGRSAYESGEDRRQLSRASAAPPAVPKPCKIGCVNSS